jgi:hypothetical protein
MYSLGSAIEQSIWRINPVGNGTEERYPARSRIQVASTSGKPSSGLELSFFIVAR